MMSLYQRPLWIGLNPNLEQADANMCIWVNKPDVKTGEVSAVHINAIVRPANAVRNGLSFLKRKAIKEELKKLGIEAQSIEIYGDEATYVYSADKFELLYMENRFLDKEVTVVDEV